MLSFTIPGVAGGELVIMEASRITLRHTAVITDRHRTPVSTDHPVMDRRPTVVAEPQHRFMPSAMAHLAAVAVLLPVVLRAVIHAVQAVRLVRVWDRHLKAH